MMRAIIRIVNHPEAGILEVNMSIDDSVLEAPKMSDDKLPPQHRCPIWVQYLLASPLRKLMEPPRKLLGPFVEPGMTVLEPGCGFGYFSLPLARMVGPEGRVLSVDVEPRAVAKLERRARKAGLADRIVARSCQARDLGLADLAGQVDLVTVIHAMHELEDLPGFLAQVATLLKPGGRMLVVEPAGHVSADQFAVQLQRCSEAGFTRLDTPALSRQKRAALLAAPAR
jgi:2-polyprenyl-3-methyl-5-hydroxy-6-metoxy-1,4-benzoquinol methylase